MVTQARRICDAAVALSRRGLPDSLRGLPEVLQSEALAESQARKEALEEARGVLDPEFMESETWKRIEWQLQWLPGEAKRVALCYSRDMAQELAVMPRAVMEPALGLARAA